MFLMAVGWMGGYALLPWSGLDQKSKTIGRIRCANQHRLLLFDIFRWVKWASLSHAEPWRCHSRQTWRPWQMSELRNGKENRHLLGECYGKEIQVNGPVREKWLQTVELGKGVGKFCLKNVPTTWRWAHGNMSYEVHSSTNSWGLLLTCRQPSRLVQGDRYVITVTCRQPSGLVHSDRYVVFWTPRQPMGFILKHV